MNHTIWEYCQLRLDWTYGRKDGEYVYRCWLEFYAPDGHVESLQLHSEDGSSSASQFPSVIGQLGGGGWELVSVQHASYQYDVGGDIFKTKGVVDPDCLSAYFKRHAEAGRAVNEPRIDLPRAA